MNQLEMNIDPIDTHDSLMEPSGFLNDVEDLLTKTQSDAKLRKSQLETLTGI